MDVSFPFNKAKTQHNFSNVKQDTDKEALREYGIKTIFRDGKILTFHFLSLPLFV